MQYLKIIGMVQRGISCSVWLQKRPLSDTNIIYYTGHTEIEKYELFSEIISTVYYFLSLIQTYILHFYLLRNAVYEIGKIGIIVR